MTEYLIIVQEKNTFKTCQVLQKEIHKRKSSFLTKHTNNQVAHITRMLNDNDSF